MITLLTGGENQRGVSRGSAAGVWPALRRAAPEFRGRGELDHCRRDPEQSRTGPGARRPDLPGPGAGGSGQGLGDNLPHQIRAVQLPGRECQGGQFVRSNFLWGLRPLHQIDVVRALAHDRLPELTGRRVVALLGGNDTEHEPGEPAVFTEITGRAKVIGKFHDGAKMLVGPRAIACLETAQAGNQVAVNVQAADRALTFKLVEFVGLENFQRLFSLVVVQPQQCALEGDIAAVVERRGEAGMQFVSRGNLLRGAEFGVQLDEESPVKRSHRKSLAAVRELTATTAFCQALSIGDNGAGDFLQLCPGALRARLPQQVDPGGRLGILQAPQTLEVGECGVCRRPPA